MNRALEEEVGALLGRSCYRDAFGCAMAGYGPEIRGYLARILKTDDQVDEAFSETWESIWKSLPTFRLSSSFRTWAYRIASHAASKVRKHHRRLTPLDSALEDELVKAEPSSLPRHVKSEEKRRLARARASLSCEDQELLTLRIDRNLSWNEIAFILSAGNAVVKPDALRSRFNRLKTTLKQLLSDAGAVYVER